MVKSCEPNDYPQFGALSQKVIEEKSAKLKEWIWESDSEIPRNRLSISNDCVLNIIDLVERRRVYFHVFHGINMSEWNEIALYCFWITKLQPFFEIPPSNIKARPANEVNAILAVRMLYNTANKIRQNKGKDRIGLSCISNLAHAFRYRDLSKEAVMAIFEALIEK